MEESSSDVESDAVNFSVMEEDQAEHESID